MSIVNKICKTVEEALEEVDREIYNDHHLFKSEKSRSFILVSHPHYMECEYCRMDTDLDLLKDYGEK